MAINVNTVYTTVLYILNKEQRGYVTPTEFNSIADLVQREIFTSYFPDGNQQNRRNQNNTENDTEFFNMYKDTAYLLHPFEKEITFVYNTANTGFTPQFPATVYRVGEVVSTYTGQPQYDSITQLTSKKDFDKITRSKLTAPTKQNPLYYITNTTIAPATEQQLLLKISPIPNSIKVNGLTTPTLPIWGFTVGSLGQFIYNPNASVNFSLDVSELPNLIINILKYFGVVINDPTIIQVASQEARDIEINEKS